MITASFNANDYVLLKITDSGREIFTQHFKSLNLDPSPYLERLDRDTDAEGWTKMQLWEVMRHFGIHCYNGQMHPPFELNMRISVNPTEAAADARIAELEAEVDRLNEQVRSLRPLTREQLSQLDSVARYTRIFIGTAQMCGSDFAREWLDEIGEKREAIKAKASEATS